MQANAFIRMLVDQPTMLKIIRTVPMNGPTMQVNKIGFDSRILHAAPASGSYLAAGNRSAPSTEQVNLLTKEIIAEVHIPYDVLEDNIERGKLEDTIMSLIAERAARDLEELIITGNTASGDAYLALMDGMIVQAVRHVCAFGAGTGVISKSVFKDMMKCMPNKYLRQMSGMRHFVSPHTEIELADSIANRITSNLGDKTYVREPHLNNIVYGIPVEGVALMPNANAILTYPKNVIWGVQRQIMIETDRDIRARVLIIVLTMRCDIRYEENDAVVLATGLTPDADITCTEHVYRDTCVWGPCAAAISCA